MTDTPNKEFTTTVVNKDKRPFIKTFSGRMFPLVDPSPDDIYIEDIAHGLSMCCRYSGQCRFFYCVAQHSVLMSNIVPSGWELQALMHDAAEAYVGDMTAPMKYWLHQNENHVYGEVENAIMDAIAAKFGIQARKPAEVGEVDKRIFATESRDNMIGGSDYGNMPHILHGGWPEAYDDVEVIPWSPPVAEHKFLKRFAELTDARG